MYIVAIYTLKAYKIVLRDRFLAALKEYSLGPRGPPRFVLLAVHTAKEGPGKQG